MKREIKITEDKYRQGRRDRERLLLLKEKIKPINKVLEQIKVGEENNKPNKK